MLQHSPTPWKIIRLSDYIIDDEDEEGLDKILSIRDAEGGTVVPTDSGYYTILEGNARLIVAAPDLLRLAQMVAKSDALTEEIRDFAVRCIDNATKEALP